MRPEDQDELRRQAQRVLSRRISADPESSVHTPDAETSRRPQQFEPRRQRQPDQPRRDRQTERRPQADADGRRVIQRVEIADTRAIDEAAARAVRRSVADNRPATVQRSSAYRATHNQRRDQLRAILLNKDARKQAILLSEILGKPVSLRNQGESGFQG